jgi:predicted dehydrogenase
VSTVRWGILATGTIAGVLAEDLALVPDAELVAVGSRTPEAAQRFAQRYHVPRAYGSWAELAADPDVDVVYVATPHSAHHAAARMCLEAGKHVLCEKAFTLDLATTLDLVDLARERGLFLMEAMWMRCNPAIRRLVDLVASGRIGEVRAVHADFGFASREPATHRLHARELGGGALLDLGVYVVSFAHLFLGEPASIAAWATLSAERVDTNTGMLFGYDSGALATLTCTFLASTPQIASVSGTQGRVELAHGFYRPESLVLHRDGEVETIPVPYEGLGYVHEIREVQRCLGLGLTESPLVPLADTVGVMRTLDAVRAQIGVTY